MTITIAIIFGGKTPEHSESIRATRILHRNAIQDKLDRKYRFKYFYLSKSNRIATSESSRHVLSDKKYTKIVYTSRRLLELYTVDIIYNTMMGICGENGNIMGLANVFNIPVIGSGILGSALTLDKKLSKIVAEHADIPIVEYLCANRKDNAEELDTQISKTLGYPCFVKPTNLGTCAHVFKAYNSQDFITKWQKTIHRNNYSNNYLIEKFVPNTEVRVFVFEDYQKTLHTNDEYTTMLKETALKTGGSLFDHVDNNFPLSIRNKIREYAKIIFREFEMKDYGRIDFFITEDHSIFFNEANTQPFISSYNIQLLEKDGISFDNFIEMMIRKNLS